MTERNETDAFIDQNPYSARGLSRDQIELYAEHHSGGLIVLGGYAGSGSYVKMHDTWGPGTEGGEPGDIVVHEYDPENFNEDAEDDKVAFFTDGPTALKAFLTALGESGQ